MEPSEVFSLRILSEPNISEDSVYFTTNWVENGMNCSVISRYDGVTVENITENKHERYPTMKDGVLYYINKVGEIEQLVKLFKGNESVICTLTKILKYKIVGRAIFLLGERIDDTDKDEVFITRKLKYRFDGRGLLTSRRKIYAVYDETNIKQILGGEYDIQDFDVHTDDVIFTAAIDSDDMDLALQDVYKFNLKTNDLKKITEEKGSAVLVSTDKDGKIAYVGHRKGMSLAIPNYLMIPSEKKEVQIGMDIDLVFSDLFPAPANHLIYDNSNFYTIGEVGGINSLYKYDGNDTVEMLTSKTFCVRDFDVSSGNVCYIYSNFKVPSAIVFNGNTYNPNEGFIGTDARLYRRNGIDFWVMLKHKLAPTILFIHGGPHNAFGVSYFYEFDFMYKNGFNVVFANPSGSKGYGEEFSKRCIGDWAGKDFNELMDIVMHLRNDFGLVDNFHVTGLSYGGFMTCAIATKTIFFKSAIAEAPVTNLVSMCGTSDIGFWFNSIEAKVMEPWNKTSMYRLLKLSPIYNIKNVKTPVMFIHGESDYRCPIEQSEQMYTALLIKGIETQLMRLKNESHSYLRIGNPKVKSERLNQKLKWFIDHSKQ